MRSPDVCPITMRRAHLNLRVVVCVFLGKRVLELGTGLGMPGLAAGALGAREVWLTDHAIIMAQANLQANFQEHERGRFHVHQLSWGNAAHIADARPPFELLLGSDISYNAGDLTTLASTMAALSQPGSVVWWATADGNCNDASSVGGQFYASLRKHGYRLTDMSSEPAVVAAVDDVSGWFSRSPLERLAQYVVRDRRYFLGTKTISVTRMVMMDDQAL